MIKRNDNNLHVIKAQLQLRHLSFYNGLIDGHFTDEFEDAVELFQHKLGLIVDGIVGPYTSTKLKQLTKNKLFGLCWHCADSPEGRHFSGHQVELMHTLPVNKGGRGWSRPGYSDIFELDGKVANLRNWDQDDMVGEWEYTFGVKFETLLNNNSRHACYIGGRDKNNRLLKDTRTPAQIEQMIIYTKFNILRNPKIIIYGHNQVQNKGCPSFDVPQWCRKIGIPEYNIANWGKLYK